MNFVKSEILLESHNGPLTQLLRWARVARGGGKQMETERPLILLLENDASDIFLFRRALARLGYRGSIRTVTGVSEAISYLQHRGSYDNPEYSPRPDLIVCDLKLFASTGTEMLQWIRTQDEFRHIPVVMLSGSALPSDESHAHELGARAFYMKSGDIDEMTDRMRSLLKHAHEHHV
jgi:two-component system, chemotaxis family, response regulator Rcp1